MKNHFASNLKYLRLQAKMTQEELAKKLDKDYSTIGKWELGQRSPIMTDVIKIASFFNISLETLISKSLIHENQQINQMQEKRIKIFNKIEDLSEEKQNMILNVTENIIKEINKE